MRERECDEKPELMDLFRADGSPGFMDTSAVIDQHLSLCVHDATHLVLCARLCHAGKDPPWHGLVNIGNTCYLIDVMKILAGVNGFSN